MIVRAPCGHMIEDEVYSHVCTPEGHYPIGTSAETFCKTCDMYKPCLCNRRETLAE